METNTTTTTKTFIKYLHILKEDYVLDNNYYGEIMIAKAGKVLKETKKACLYKNYLADETNMIPRYIPGDLVKVIEVKTTTTTTATQETKELAW